MDPYLWYCILGLIAYLLFQLVVMRRPKDATPEKFSIGEITSESLRYYCGYDYSKPNLIAIEGEVYDVSCAMRRATIENSLNPPSQVTALPDYAPGKELHPYAGREAARAIALGSIKVRSLLEQ